MPARLLIIDGNTAESTERIVALGGEPYGQGYARALRSLVPNLDVTVIRPALPNAAALPAAASLEQFHGVVWTGSALSAYWDHPGVRRQIELARAVFASGVPSFGSCWGLQIMCQALGGEVKANPRGQEIGIARRLRLTPAGRLHPMYAGKPDVFDAVTVHNDEVTRLPPGAAILASNDESAVQAVAIEQGGDFWGVQYHPEFDLKTIGLILRRDAARLVERGLARSETDVEVLVGDLAALQADPQGRRDLAWRYGIDAMVTDPAARMAELANWLQVKVLPRVSACAAAAPSLRNQLAEGMPGRMADEREDDDQPREQGSDAKRRQAGDQGRP